ncbi:MAG: hypothetical protein FWE09_06025 [Treponema sp.]|nr:hypothetical protein [Treponema sp.]
MKGETANEIPRSKLRGISFSRGIGLGDKPLATNQGQISPEQGLTKAALSGNTHTHTHTHR